MEMDCNLTKLDNSFKFFPCILERSLKINYGLFFLVRAVGNPSAIEGQTAKILNLRTGL